MKRRFGGGKEAEILAEELNDARMHFRVTVICVHHVVEVKKLTSEYMYRVASGIGRGEKTRTSAISKTAYLIKVLEYFLKLGAAVILGFKYALQFTPSKIWPIVKFRIDALKGLLG